MSDIMSASVQSGKDIAKLKASSHLKLRQPEELALSLQLLDLPSVLQVCHFLCMHTCPRFWNACKPLFFLFCVLNIYFRVVAFRWWIVSLSRTTFASGCAMCAFAFPTSASPKIAMCLVHQKRVTGMSKIDIKISEFCCAPFCFFFNLVRVIL